MNTVHLKYKKVYSYLDNSVISYKFMETVTKKGETHPSKNKEEYYQYDDHMVIF